MTRRWCHCGAPLWRVEAPGGCLDCRVCWLTSYLPTKRLTAYERATTSFYYANSTDDTAATSTWLPPGAVRMPPIPDDSVPLSGDLPRLQATLWRMSPRPRKP